MYQKDDSRHLRALATTMFDNPQYRGHALDWCRLFERECGKPAADAFCKAEGHEEATSYPKKRSWSEETMCIGDNANCDPDHHRCDTFNYIICRRSEQTFRDPREHNRALDWCKNYETSCGKPAADAYCQSKGLTEASSYPKRSWYNRETMCIGNHAVCDPDYHRCDTFRSITCTD